MFDSKRPNEEDSFAFDFTDLLATGETVDSAVVEVEVVNGTDPNPADMIAGTPTILSPLVHIKLVGGVEGAIYCVHCLGTTSQGLKKLISSDLKVTEQC